jgi:S-adenosyl-L-methionine hydrolase (adenosine-forming)
VPRQPIITLTTDFGLADPYVASMRGVILSLNPQAVIVDVSHAVRPQQIEQGAFLLEASLPYFPPSSIHIAVVDPGVGSQRRAIALRTASGTFVGPDNGVLSPALPDDLRSRAGEAGGRVRLPERSSGVALTDPSYHRQPVSDTFHGRDIFAPAAGHLSLGVPLSDLGEPVDDVVALPPFRARSEPDGSRKGRIVHIDVFGNLITDVRGEDLASPRLTVEVRDRQIAGLQRNYASGQGLTALVGSSGFLEITLSGGSAVAELGVDIGEPVVVQSQL